MPRGIAKSGKRKCSPRVEHIVRACEICGRERSYAPSQIRVREEHLGQKIRYCSTTCQRQSLKKPDSYAEIKCAHCEKPFRMRVDHLKEANYCSKACSDLARRKEDARWRDPKQIKIYMAEYHQKNKDILRESGRAWNIKNRHKKLSIQGKYRRSHKDIITVLAHQRRSQSQAGDFTAQDWQEIKQHYNFTCLCCRRREPAISLTVDHVIPLKLNGRHHKSNIQPLCKSCNSRKHIKIIDYRPYGERYEAS